MDWRRFAAGSPRPRLGHFRSPHLDTLAILPPHTARRDHANRCAAGDDRLHCPTMNRRASLFKWFRISTTALCLIVCCLLVVLWWRSYETPRSTGRPLAKPVYYSRDFAIYSEHGWITVLWWSGLAANYQPRESPLEFEMQAMAILRQLSRDAEPRVRSWVFFLLFDSQTRWFAGIPHWFSVLTFALLAAIPWILRSPRFSLRTLFIVTTLIAVGLGLIVWATR